MVVVVVVGGGDFSVQVSGFLGSLAAEPGAWVRGNSALLVKRYSYHRPSPRGAITASPRSDSGKEQEKDLLVS